MQHGLRYGSLGPHFKVFVPSGHQLASVEAKAQRQSFLRAQTGLASEQSLLPAEHHDRVAFVLARNSQQVAVGAEADLKERNNSSAGGDPDIGELRPIPAPIISISPFRFRVNRVWAREALNPFRAAKPLPILIPSNLSPKTGFEL